MQVRGNNRDIYCITHDSDIIWIGRNYGLRFFEHTEFPGRYAPACRFGRSSGRKRYALEGAKGDQGDGGKRRECHRRRQSVLCVYAIPPLAIRQP